MDNFGNLVSLTEYAVDHSIYGNIRSVEFTTEYENDVIYFSASTGENSGNIYRMDLATGLISSMATANEFGNTWLQTASDGFIYCVSNSGNYLGRIIPYSNSFQNNVLNITANSNSIVEYYVDFGPEVYHLPSNFSYEPFHIEYDKMDESCAWESDGWIQLYVSGGIQPYTYQWDDPLAQTTALASQLAHGVYTCTVTDAVGNIELITVEIKTDPTLFNYSGSYEISTPTLWDGVDYKIDGIIEIVDGGSLTIINGSKAEFNAHSGFKVSSGGKLEFYYETELSGLTACDNKLWSGIVVEDQGYVKTHSLLIQNCTSEIKAGGTLHVDANGYLNVVDDGIIKVRSGSYICVDETATIDLTTVESTMELENGFNYGINPNITINPAPTCYDDPCSWNLIGGGSIHINENYLYLDDIVIEENSTAVFTNENWSLKENIILEPYSRLSIVNSNLKFSKTSKIIVMPGAELIVENSTLDNIDFCLIPYWQGIEVWGIKSEPQKPMQGELLEQGKLVLEDATIEDALIAVDLWNPGDWSSTGGMVYANGATFTNNTKSVHALHYENFNPYYPQVEWDYMSNFKNCTFEITSTYHGKKTFYKHVDLAHVKGIDFQSCYFSLAEGVEGVSTWTHAIGGYNAKFRISSLCSSNIVPCPDIDYDRCTFTGFYSAIHAVNDGSEILSFNVSRGDFIDNVYGIQSRYMNSASVLFSTFQVGHLWECGAGIYMDNVTGFAFEENNFSKFSGGPLSNYYGILINNSQQINEIYKNDFIGLSYANYSDGKNWRDDHRYLGLEYRCNTNSNNYADFYVVDRELNGSDHSGIQTYQGNNINEAGNTFSTTGSTWHFHNKGEHLLGLYYGPNNEPDEQKLLNVARYPMTSNYSCPSHYGGTSGLETTLTAQQKIDAEQAYYDNYTVYLNVKALYDNYTDGGSTEQEITDIQNAQPEDMWVLRAQLLGHSPHLSLEVLIEASDKTDVFTESALFDILAANPDELKKDTLISYLENKEDPLPDYMIDILEQMAEGVTYKTVLQQEMAEYAQNYIRAANDIIRNNLNDSIVDLTELRNWLDNIGGIASDRQIISTYVSEGNFTNAFTLANMLPGLYDLTGNDLIEHNYYIDMLTLFQTLHQQQRNTFELTLSEKNQLESIAAISKGVAGAQAKSILEAVYQEEYTNCPTVDGSVGYKQSSSLDNDSFSKLYGLTIDVKPNPATIWAAFDYALPNDDSKARIIITDVKGNTIDIININGKRGQKLWDTRNISAGIYVYTLEYSGAKESGKLIIRR